jgi:hypothetical protein
VILTACRPVHTLCSSCLLSGNVSYAAVLSGATSSPWRMRPCKRPSKIEASRPHWQRRSSWNPAAPAIRLSSPPGAIRCAASSPTKSSVLWRLWPHGRVPNRPFLDRCPRAAHLRRHERDHEGSDRSLAGRPLISRPGRKHLMPLEKHLGTRLLNRSRRNWSLTESGKLFLPTPKW